MTSLSRRRRKKAEKKHEVGPRRDSWQYEPPAPPVRPQDAGLIAELNSAIDQHLDLSGITLERVAGLKSVAFGRKQRAAYVPLAYVFADEAAQVHGVGRIPGNFRAAGEQWTELRALLVRIQGGLVPAVTESYDRLLTSTASLSAELAASALHASAHIRADLRVFPCPVVLESDEYQVRFEPIRRFPRLLLPFHVKRSDDLEINAALDLTSAGDPIAVAYERSADEAAVVEAWPVALLAFADLIGHHASDNSSQQTSEPSEGETSRPAGPSTGETPRRLISAGQGRPISRSKRLRPVGQNANYHGTFVVGHRRHLPPGQSCNDDARAAARVYGIELAPGWTWVQPYERGTPDGFLLRYTWQVPPQLGVSDGVDLAASVSG